MITTFPNKADLGRRHHRPNLGELPSAKAKCFQVSWTCPKNLGIIWMFYIYLITPWSTYMAQSPKGRLIQGLCKSIHGSCAIYFYPGEVNCVSLFLFCIFPETMFNVNMLSHFCTSSTINHMNPCGTITLCCLDIHACAATFHRPPPHIARGVLGFTSVYLRVTTTFWTIATQWESHLASQMSVGKPLCCFCFSSPKRLFHYSPLWWTYPKAKQ